MFYLTVSQNTKADLTEIAENFLAIRLSNFTQSPKLSLVDITESLTEKYNLEITLPNIFNCDESVLINTNNSCTQ